MAANSRAMKISELLAKPEDYVKGDFYDAVVDHYEGTNSMAKIASRLASELDKDSRDKLHAYQIIKQRRREPMLAYQNRVIIAWEHQPTTTHDKIIAVARELNI